MNLEPVMENELKLAVRYTPRARCRLDCNPTPPPLATRPAPLSTRNSARTLSLFLFA